eukprot:CAMPEP_0182557844 /NCGR_PEP_ID=MMETSP1324-20130603/1627_1 /TAXON_ID=236786 /ORGANISM="Florenciella sp., Strain RCC1587" /LENGTH=106 /DNA_ID=CAMNT_0024769971 /DNA_START=441 /DNA_END=761 /DNA_ORIENTATION=+
MFSTHDAEGSSSPAGSSSLAETSSALQTSVLVERREALATVGPELVGGTLVSDRHIQGLGEKAVGVGEVGEKAVRALHVASRGALVIVLKPMSFDQAFITAASFTQ